MARSLGFGSTACNYVALFRLAFAAAPSLKDLTLLHTSNSPVHYAKGTQSVQPRPVAAPKGGNVESRPFLLQLVSKRFQDLFHPPPGVLFTFPSRYWFTIGRQKVFSLGRWSSRFPTGFHVSRGTREFIRESVYGFRLPDYHRLWLNFPKLFD